MAVREPADVQGQVQILRPADQAHEAALQDSVADAARLMQAKVRRGSERPQPVLDGALTWRPLGVDHRGEQERRHYSADAEQPTPSGDRPHARMVSHERRPRRSKTYDASERRSVESRGAGPMASRSRSERYPTAHAGGDNKQKARPLGRFEAERDHLRVRAREELDEAP